MKKYLIALRKGCGWNCPTILVSAVDENDAISLALHLKPNSQIGQIKEVNY